MEEKWCIIVFFLIKLVYIQSFSYLRKQQHDFHTNVDHGGSHLYDLLKDKHFKKNMSLVLQFCFCFEVDN